MSETTVSINLDSAKAEQLLREIVNRSTWEDMSRKEARARLEGKMGLNPDDLKPVKNEVNRLIEKIVTELENAKNAEEPQAALSEAADSEDGDEEPSPKRARTGPEPPKNLKKLQAGMMSRETFLDSAPILEAKIGEDLAFKMKPRTFNSGSCGWFYCGKVAVNVGDKTTWCQLGVNCTVLGSKDWKESTKRKR